MGEIHVTVAVTGGDINLMDEIRDELRRTKLRVKKNPGACARCIANDDPEAVPLHRHPPCQCTVEVVEDTKRR